MPKNKQGSLVDRMIQVSPSSYVGSAAVGPFESPVDWWRCDNCGAAIGTQNWTTNEEVKTCYACGAARRGQSGTTMIDPISFSAIAPLTGPWCVYDAATGQSRDATDEELWQAADGEPDDFEWPKVMREICGDGA